MLLTRQGATLQGEDEGFRLRLRLLGGRSWPDDEDTSLRNRMWIEAEDLDGQDPPVARLHGLPHAAPEYEDGRRRVIHFQLGSTLGFLPIEIRVGPRHATTEVEVRPRKLDYQAHYLAMKSELEELAQNLLFTPGKPPPSDAALLLLKREHRRSSSAYSRTVGSSAPLVRVDAFDPHRDLVSEFEVADVSRARELGPESLADLVRQPSYWTDHPLGREPLPSTVTFGTGQLVTPMRILEDRTELLYDTPPNRVIKWGLHTVRRHVRTAMSLVAAGLPQGHFGLEAEAPYVALLEGLSRGLGGMLRQDFMADAGRAVPSDFAQHTLEADARYRSMAQLLKTLTCISPKVTGRPFVARSGTCGRCSSTGRTCLWLHSCYGEAGRR